MRRVGGARPNRHKTEQRSLIRRPPTGGCNIRASPPGEAELGGEVVVVAAPLRDGRQTPAAAKHGGGGQGEDRRQGIDRPAAVPRVGDLGKDLEEGTIRWRWAHGAIPSPMSYKARGLNR